jgi:hypothetical protein
MIHWAQIKANPLYNGMIYSTSFELESEKNRNGKTSHVKLSLFNKPDIGFFVFINNALRKGIIHGRVSKGANAK